MADSEEFEARNESRTQNSRQKDRRKWPKWNDSQTQHLIDMLEERTCLWDIYCKSYHLRDAKDKAYAEIADALERDMPDIKNKIVCLRAQLGRELAKTRKTKSGQGYSEIYKCSWLYWDRLQFLIPIMQAGKSKDTMTPTQRTTSPDSVVSFDEDSSFDESYTDSEVQVIPAPARPSIKKSSKAENEAKKNEILDACVKILKEPVQETDKKSHFAMYIAEKLERFDSRTRMIAEKRISDIIFELEMQTSENSFLPINNHQERDSVSGAHMHQGSYIGMLNSGLASQYR